MAIPKRSLSQTRTLEILKNCEYGVLSTVDQNNHPYGVGINCFYIEADNALYFHTKKVGKKITNITHQPNVSLFITTGDERIVQERFTTHYESIIVEGEATMVTDINEVERLLRELCLRLCPDATTRREEVIQKYLPAVGICKIKVQSVTGKANRDA